jgi:serine/threonine protein kinase
VNYPHAVSIPYEWTPDDVILDLYQVQNVMEGYGNNARILPFHEGGFGRVYKVWHRAWNRYMAVKTPKSGLFVTSEQKQAFIKECQTWINLGLHPHVANCHYVRDLAGVPRVFSEYADAGTLGEWISSGKLYEGDAKSILGRILDVAIQFAWGLHHAHESGVIHQDVKPLNALMWNDGTLKVSDFGISGSRQRTNFIAHVGQEPQTIMVTAGSMTPSYCSPEQHKGINLDRRTDIWSWAVSIMEIFNGGVSWATGSAAPYAFEAYLESGPMVEDIPMIPPELIPLFRKCFAQESQKRPATLLECARVIQEYYSNGLQLEYQRIEPIEVPDSVENLGNKALSMIDLGRGDDAVAFFEQALKKAPADVATIYNYNLYKWRNQLIAANEFIASFEKNKTDTPTIEQKPRLEQALIWFELGFFHQAIKVTQCLDHNDPLVQLLADELKRHIESAEQTNLIVNVPGGQLNGLFFSWDESKIFAHSTDVWIFDTQEESLTKLSGFPEKTQKIYLLPKHGWIAASHSPEYDDNVITGWDANSEKFFEIIRSEARILNLAETTFDQYLIAEVAYSHPTSLRTHFKIQTIDLNSSTIYEDILDEALIITTSQESGIVVAKSLMQESLELQRTITVWDGRQKGVITSFTLENDGGYVTTAATVDEEKMRLITSIPWKSGLVSTNLKTKEQQALEIKNLGVVSKIKAKNDQSVILAQSIIVKNGDDCEQVGIYNLESKECRAILFRSGKNGIMDIGRTTGHVAIEVSPGVVYVWREFKGNRSQYFYSDSYTYNESLEQKVHHERLIRSAKEHYRFDEIEIAFSCIQKAREIPGYEYSTESVIFWRLLGSDLCKSGIRRIVRIASYRKPVDMTHGAINENGALHPNGDMLAFVSTDSRFREDVPDPFRVFLWNPTTDNVRCLFEDLTSDHKTDRISFRDIAGNAFVFLSSGTCRHVICLNAQDSTITKFDRGDYIFNRTEQSSIAISKSGEWLVLGASRAEKDANSPPITIWSIITRTPLSFRFDPKTYSAYDVCFCNHHGRESLVIACNIGIQICSVEDLTLPQIIGECKNYRMLTCSQCREFIAAASWSRPTGAELTRTIEIFATAGNLTLIRSIIIKTEIYGMRLTKNGEILIVLCHCRLKVYLVNSGDLAFEILIDTDRHSSLSDFSEDESRVTVIGYNKIDIYELDWKYRLANSSVNLKRHE